MANILTATEAANVLRCSETDPAMLDLLPSVDKYIRMASGHDWASDDPVCPEAKSAARMLLVLLHENPAMIGQGVTSLDYGLSAMLAQLEVLAYRYQRFAGRVGAGPIALSGAKAGDTVQAVVGKIGAAGDQSTAFEAVISVGGEIQQVSTADLSGNWYEAYLVPLSDL